MNANARQLYWKLRDKLECPQCGYFIEAGCIRAGACTICDLPVPADLRVAWVTCCEISASDGLNFGRTWQRDDTVTAYYRREWKKFAGREGRSAP